MGPGSVYHSARPDDADRRDLGGRAEAEVEQIGGVSPAVVRLGGALARGGPVDLDGDHRPVRVERRRLAAEADIDPVTPLRIERGLVVEQAERARALEQVGEAVAVAVPHRVDLPGGDCGPRGRGWPAD